MAKKKKSLSVPELWVVFDTNAIYTGSASFLVRKEVADVIGDNSGHADLRIRWLLPAIVRHERQYQMTRQALGFVPTVEKLERLIGINLNIAPDILELRVREAVERHAAQLGIEIEDLDLTATNWQQIVLDAAYRRPPFEAGEKEKGFRDAIVLETFLQVAGRAPQSAKTCRLAFVSGDKLLLKAAELRTTGLTNVRLFETVEELHGLINTLVSEVDEDFVKELVPQAQKIFFIPQVEESLYYVEKVWSTISAQIGSDIGSLPTGADRHKVAGITVNPPRFVSKERQVIHWSSRIEVKLEALKSVISSKSDWSLLTFGSSSKDMSLPTAKPYDLVLSSLSKPVTPEWSNYVFDPDTLAFGVPPQVVGNGRAAYDVYWKTTVSTTRKLTHPAIERTQFVEIAWS